MAANFSSAGNTCAGENCEAITNVTYYVKEKKRLCDNCASKEGCIGKTRKVGSNIYCRKHGKAIKLYCKTHDAALCYSCAMTDHHQPCVRRDIEGAIVENKANLNDLKEKAKNKLERCRLYGDEIRQCKEDTNTHLQALTKKVDSVINEAIKKDKEREKEDATKINQEVEEKNQNLQEEIQKINDKIRKNGQNREKRLEMNRKNAKRRREKIDNKQNGLQTDIKDIDEMRETKIVEWENSLQDVIETTETAVHTIDTVLGDDQSVVNDWHLVYTSVSDELRKQLYWEHVSIVTCAISGVRFVKGAGREKYDGRIDGNDRSWKLIDTIKSKDNITHPIIVGYIDECNVIITDDMLGSDHTYVLDLTTKHTQRVITSSGTSCVISSALLNHDKVVCGKYRNGCTGDSLTGCISVYNRQWKHIKDVTIPRNTTGDSTRVNVAVDQDGMIIAAEWFQSNIYVINPADGKIMNTITCEENIIMSDVLSSGHIIAQPYPSGHSVFIIDRQGAETAIPHSTSVNNACVDPTTDELYVVTLLYEEGLFRTCVINRVMSGGDIENHMVASFVPFREWLPLFQLYDFLQSSKVLITSSGKMIACDGKNILVFKNGFSFHI